MRGVPCAHARGERCSYRLEAGAVMVAFTIYLEEATQRAKGWQGWAARLWNANNCWKRCSCVSHTSNTAGCVSKEGGPPAQQRKGSCPWCLPVVLMNRVTRTVRLLVMTCRDRKRSTYVHSDGVPAPFTRGPAYFGRRIPQDKLG